jgi:hypothetical protein
MKHKIKINVDVFNDSKNISLEVVDSLFPESKLLSLDINEQPQYLAMKVAFFNLLWDEVFFPVFNRLGKPIPYTSNLEEIFESTDSIDRY